MQKLHDRLEQLPKKKQFLLFISGFFLMLFVGFMIGALIKSVRVASVMVRQEKMHKEQAQRLQNLVRQYDATITVEK